MIASTVSYSAAIFSGPLSGFLAVGIGWAEPSPRPSSPSVAAFPSPLRGRIQNPRRWWQRWPRVLGASVLVDQPTVVYRLTREALEQMEVDDPALAMAFHKFVVRALAELLDFTNREVAALQS